MNDFATAGKKLERLNRLFNSGTAIEVDQLATYVGLRTKNTKQFVKHGELACEAGDMTACWTLMAQMNWEDITPLLESEDVTAPKTHLGRQLASSDYQAQAFVEEEIYVDQRDIDELDESLIKLIKN